MTEVDLFERFGVGAGCFNHNVVFNHLGVIRLQCSWHRGNSFSIAHEIHLYFRAGSLPLDLVVAIAAATANFDAQEILRLKGLLEVAGPQSIA